MLDLDTYIANHIASRHKYDNGEGGIESNEGVHCPHCEHFHEEGGDGMCDSDAYRDGENDFSCSNCGKDFIVETRIEYTWVSIKPEPST